MKKLISLLLALILCLCTCISVGAATYFRYGDFRLSAESVQGAAEFSVSSYMGTDSAVVMPSEYGGYPITAISPATFAGNTKLTEVTMSENISVIGSDAFLSAKNLEKVVMTASVNEIGESAFSDTPALKEINLSDSSVTRIAPYTFLNSGITSITLPDTCTAIGTGAFAQCVSLTEIVIPNSVTEIAEDAFSGCNNVVIRCCEGSYAQEYVEALGISYEIIEPTAYMLGDADGDGIITIIDATKIQRVLAGLTDDDDGMIAMRGDVNGNGLDILDATKIQRYLAGFTTAEPIGTIITA